MHTKDDTLLQRAQRFLAGGPGTFSKHPSRYPQGLAPTALVHGKGCYVLGDNGRTYLDTVAALGPIILGYGHPAVTEAVMAEVRHGTSFSMMHPLEIEVAEQLTELLPCAEMVRFARNGTDATSMAVRVARAATGKQHVIFIGYAGGAMDSYGITTDRSAGILPQLKPYNHQVAWDHEDALLDVLDGCHKDLAAIVCEVAPMPWGTADGVIQSLLHLYRDLAHVYNALFILDEIVTFPRESLYGAQYIYACYPDLCTASKALANGLPLAALVGKRQHMKYLDTGDIFASWTFAGETTSLAAAKATLGVLSTTDALSNLHDCGQVYGDGLEALFTQYNLPVQLWGTPARLSIRWHDVEGVATAQELRTLWLAEHARRGILMGIGVVFPMACWSDAEIELLTKAAHEVCQLIRHAIDRDHVQAALPCPIISDVMSVR